MRGRVQRLADERLENPDHLRLLRQRAALSRSAVEEMRRYVSPVEQATERDARQDVRGVGSLSPWAGAGG